MDGPSATVLVAVHRRAMRLEQGMDTNLCVRHMLDKAGLSPNAACQSMGRANGYVDQSLKRKGGIGAPALARIAGVRLQAATRRTRGDAEHRSSEQERSREHAEGATQRQHAAFRKWRHHMEHLHGRQRASGRHGPVRVPRLLPHRPVRGRQVARPLRRGAQLREGGRGRTRAPTGPRAGAAAAARR